jgi:hypothetical protein
MLKFLIGMNTMRDMDDEWSSYYDLVDSELCYGIPTDPRNIPSLARRILKSSYVDVSQGFDLEILLELDHEDETIEEDPESFEEEIVSLAERLRFRIESVLGETQQKFGFSPDLSGWTEGFATVVDYTENVKKLSECISYLNAQTDLFEYCSLSLSFYLAPVSQLFDDPGFARVCDEIEQRTGGEFSIRGKSELGPYDGINAGSSFYQMFLLVSPLYEFPLRFFRGQSEDNSLAYPYYHYIFSDICRRLDCKLTLLKA